MDSVKKNEKKPRPLGFELFIFDVVTRQLWPQNDMPVAFICGLMLSFEKEQSLRLLPHEVKTIMIHYCTGVCATYEYSLRICPLGDISAREMQMKFES